MGRSKKIPVAVRVLWKVSKKLKIRIRAWEKVKRLLNEEPDAIFVAKHLSKRMTQILKEERNR